VAGEGRAAVWGVSPEGEKPGTEKKFLPSLDTHQKLLHNLVSLLLAQFTAATKRQTPSGFRGLSSTEFRRSHGTRSLTIEQPISVGAWNARGTTPFHEGVAK
jgi:hypothetical protein